MDSAPGCAIVPHIFSWARRKPHLLFALQPSEYLTLSDYLTLQEGIPQHSLKSPTVPSSSWSFSSRSLGMNPPAIVRQTQPLNMHSESCFVLKHCFLLLVFSVSPPIPLFSSGTATFCCSRSLYIFFQREIKDCRLTTNECYIQNIRCS